MAAKAENGAAAASAAKLTPKQERFVAEYLVDLNATQAAIRAGYSERSAEVTGSRLLRNAKVAAAIGAAKQVRAERVQVEQDAVVREFARIAFSDMRAFVEWGPSGVRLKDCGELTDDQAAAVAEVSQTISEGGGSIKFKLHNKVEALTKLGQHLGMFEERVRVSGKLLLVRDLSEVTPVDGEG